MSMMLDLQYVGYIVNRLRKCTSVKTDVWSSHCPHCDGSTTNPNKKTFYIYPKDGKLMTYCHCCQTTKEMKWFLFEFDRHLFKEYCKQEYLDQRPSKTTLNKTKTVRKDFLDVKIKTAPSGSTIDYRAILANSPFVSLLDLPDNHKTKVYLRSRMIPESKWERLAYIKNMSEICTYFPDYVNLEKSSDDRLVFPIINAQNELVGASCRSLNKHNLQRYIELSFKTDADMIFGLERLDVTKKVYIVEGAFDACLLDNAISICGLALHGISKIGIPKDNLVLIPDRQPKHKNVVKAIEKMVEAGYAVCLMPETYYNKDLNDMLINGEITIDKMKTEVDKNTYQGLRAKLFFSKWRGV